MKYSGFIPSAGVMHAMDSFLAPSPSVFTTVFYKPIWLFHFIGAAIPFLVFNRESAVKPKVFRFHEALRNDPDTKSLKIGSAGFCWGGGYTIYLAQDPNLVDVAFTAHPSRMKFPDEWEKVQKPLSVAIGDVDMGIKIDMVKDIKNLLESETKPKGQNEVVIYPGAKHGFAMRADPKDEGQTKSAGEALTQAVAWFTKWMV
jgi:dienelactone hydrolase